MEEPKRATPLAPPAGCVFAKPCTLPDGQIDYPRTAPAELISRYGKTEDTCEEKMGLRIRLNWYDKHNDLGVGREYSDDMGDDASMVELLGLPINESVNNGEFDILMSG